jgi:hypothetical protein
MGIYNTGSGSSITISNNTIANLTNGTTGSYGTLTGINNGNGVVIIDNNTVRDLRISNLSTASVNTVIGINMLNSFIAGHQVLGNTIYNLSNDNTGFIGNIIGLYCTDLSPANNSAQNNLIYGLSVLSSGSMISGIYLNSGNWNLMNNMISLGEGVSAGALIYGYYDKGDLTDSHFYNNSIDIRGTVSGTTNFTYALMSASAIASRTYVNNILINERTGGTTGVHYAISLPDGTSNLTNNYNDYFAPNGVPGIYNNIQTTNLSDLQLATGQDANSISRAVTFVSATDLHLSGGSIGDFALTGTPLAE